MLDHVSLGVRDIDRSRRFYDAALRPLGLVRIVDFGGGRGSDYGAAPGSLGVEFTIKGDGIRGVCGIVPDPGSNLAVTARQHIAEINRRHAAENFYSCGVESSGGLDRQHARRFSAGGVAGSGGSTRSVP